jgi:hypothetical protein
MSWKSLVTTGVLCVIASPAFAVPALSVDRNFDTAVTGIPSDSNNYLDANGDWVWVVKISPTDPIPTGSSPLAAELGFTAAGVPTGETAALKGASNMSTGANDDFDTNNPGTSIFGWEATGGAATNGKPEGLQTNCAAGCTTTAGANQVFSALGSVVYSTTGAKDYIQIKTRGPSDGGGTGNLNSTLTTSGAYGGKGRIAEASGGTPPSTNHDTYNNVFSRTAVAGDANMDGAAADGDLNIVLTNLNKGFGNRRWFHGNFTNHLDSETDDADLNLMLINLNITSGTIGNGAGGGLSGGGVPEPSTFALLGLGLLGSMGLIRRKR